MVITKTYKSNNLCNINKCILKWAGSKGESWGSSFDYMGSWKDKEDDNKDEEKEEPQKYVSAKGMFAKQCYNYKEIWRGMRAHCEFPKGLFKSIPCMEGSKNWWRDNQTEDQKDGGQW
jgi:hypothetical protein